MTTLAICHAIAVEKNAIETPTTLLKSCSIKHGDKSAIL